MLLTAPVPGHHDIRSLHSVRKGVSIFSIRAANGAPRLTETSYDTWATGSTRAETAAHDI